MARPNDALPTIARRLAAGRKLLDGIPVEQIAEELGMAKTTVEKYRQVMEDGGLDALRDISVGGRRSALDESARTWIAEALRGSPRDYGFDADGWTNARMRELIRRQFGISYSRVYAWQLATDLGVSHRFDRSGR
jgi:transposase